jgi:drug/metabolite transporter (DMT)-like permease
MDWYVYSIIAFFLYGINNFLYKVSAEKKCNTALTTFYFMLTVTILSAISFFVMNEKIVNWYLLLVLAFFNAITFFTLTVTKIESLKHIPTSIAYPILRLNVVFVVIFSIIYFKDKLSIFQVCGIILSIFVFFVLTQNNGTNSNKKNKNFKLGVILILISLIASAFCSVLIKFAAVSVNRMGFIFIAYIMNTFLAFFFRNKFQTKTADKKHKNAIIIGFFMGIFNFIGFNILLKALSIGPLSLIASINAMSFVMVIILSVIIYKEKITKRNLFGILLSIVAVILLRM